MILCLNRSVLEFMGVVLSPQAFVLEFGVGGSTRWFAERCGWLLSIEASTVWAERARCELAGASCEWDVRMEAELPSALNGITAVDLALIDGVWENRDACARMAWPLLRPGGWLVFDDAQRERHVGTVAWLNKHGDAQMLRWAPGDVEAARERVAMAWQKPPCAS